MSMENPKSSEIKRLTAPLTIKNFKAYDSSDNLLSCTETLSDVRFIVEPREHFLNDDDILQYAPESKSASKIRLKRGFGDFQDVLLVHESLPWIMGLFYTVLISIAIPVVFSKNTPVMYLILVLSVLPLIYAYYIFNLNRYVENKSVKSVDEPVKQVTNETNYQNEEIGGVESLKKYEKDIHDLTVLFEVREEVVRDLIKKRFEPPQITYDKFISTVDSCHKLFYAQSDSALNIINLASEDTPRVQDEIKNKLDAMKKIINQIEDLTNELVINISSSGSGDEIKNLLEDMEDLIESVKDY